jgi:hypothetical protein
MRDGRIVQVQQSWISSNPVLEADVWLEKPVSLKLSISRRRFFSGLNMGGLRCCPSGDAFLDKHFVFRSDDPVIAAALVTAPGVREALADAAEKRICAGGISLHPQNLHYLELGTMPVRAHIARTREVILLMMKLATAIDAAGELLPQSVRK